MAANDRQEYGSHYQSTFQHWDLVELWGIGYLEGCATKYLTRWRKKNGLQDLKKASHYVEKLIELSTREHKPRKPRGVVPLPALTEFYDSNGISDPRERAALFILTGWWDTKYLQHAHDMIDNLIIDAEAHGIGQ